MALSVPRPSRPPPICSPIITNGRPTPLPVNATIRSLECWSMNGCAGDTLSDAYAARAALARNCRYGLNLYGRLVFVFLPGQGKVEYDIQSNSTRMTRPTIEISAGVLRTLVAMTRQP